MKKTIISFLMTFMPLLVIADDVEVNGIFYKFDTTNQTASVSSNPNKYQGEIVIPEAVTHENKQYRVTSIGPCAFYQCTGLTSVTFPNSLTRIEMSAFQGCTSLPTSFVIPESIRNIGRSAFSGTNIVALTVCGGTSIEKYSFICQNLTTLKLLHNASFYDSALAGSPISEIYFYSDAKPDINIDAFGIPPGEDDLKKITIYVQPKFVEELKDTNPWKAFAKILPIPGQTFKLTYLVDGEIFKTCELSEGDAITPVPEPIKEGYTFSGWSDIPTTMPAKDVTVIGSFTINKYKLIYMVDGAEYRNYDVEYGATITPDPKPTKEGYTFSGWSDIPTTMPAKDVTVTGSFTINKYKLIYMVDGAEYRNYDVEYGAPITPEPKPTKEGYSFSGWSDIPATMPAKDVTVTGSFSKGAYKLTYMLDGEVYKTISYDYGDAIMPEPAPVKEGYTFSGWSDIPATMPAKDVSVNGSFTINKYKLIYMVDGEEYRKYEVEYGAPITPEPKPTKEGYCFSGWSEIPATMPAKDVLINGRFIEIDNPQPHTEPEQNITKNHVVYKIEGDYVVVIQTDNASGGVRIEPFVVIDGNTYIVTSIGSSAFKGCTAIISVEIPNTVAAIGEKAFDGCTELCTVIIGSGIREIARKAFANIFKQNSRTRGDDEGLHFYCEAEVVPATSAEAFKGTDIANATLHVPDNLVETYKYVAPWNEFGNIVGFSNTGIRAINIDTSDVLIFDEQGNRQNTLRKGVNIVRTMDGITKKILVR